MNVLITGSNSGIGFEAAKKLLLQGHRVYIVCRDKAKTLDTLEKLKPFGRVEKAADELQLEDLKSVHKFATEDFKLATLHCLINNAGVMGIPELRKTKQGLEYTVGVNYVAHFLLTRLLLGRLEKGALERKGEPSRIVHVSSDAHMFVKDVDISNAFLPETEDAYNSQAQYAYSKLFQIWDCAELNERYTATSDKPRIVTFALHPGVVETNIVREMPEGVMEAVKSSMSSKSGWRMLTAEEGCATTVFCATASFQDLQCSPPLNAFEKQVQYYRDVARATKLSKLAQDSEKARKVIATSYDLTKSYLDTSSSKL